MHLQLILQHKPARRLSSSWVEGVRRRKYAVKRVVSMLATENEPLGIRKPLTWIQLPNFVSPAQALARR